MRYWTLLLLLMAARPAFSQMPPSDQLDSVLNKQDPAQPGLALCIMEKGRVVYRRAIGVSELGSGQALNEFSNFRLASLSKQFTAMGILLLARDQRLSLEDPIGRWLPELPAGVGKKVLIRHLLTHSSGILDYETLMSTGPAASGPVSAAQQLSDTDVLHLLSRVDSTLFPPGTAFRYSNSGFCLLALIVERASHQTFADYIRDHIFIPLGMKDSRIYVAGSPIPHRAMGYARDSSGHIYPSDQSLTSATKGDGGVYTSLTDYSKWLTALDQGMPLDLGKVMAGLRFPIQDLQGSFYGAGWFDVSARAAVASGVVASGAVASTGEAAASEPDVYFHSGSTCGFSTFVIRVPSKDWFLMYFSNVADNTESFRQIIDILKPYGIADFSQMMRLHELTR